MSMELLHIVRRQLLAAQEQLIRDYQKAGENWPEMPTVAAQSAIFQAHGALLPIAYTFGNKFGDQFFQKWDEAIGAVQVAQRKPGHAPVRPQRVAATQPRSV